ncbi:replicative helicase loader/inhibitor [Fuchsiella alkaliacetigena]|uniref:replicative helicase loader/inhibitor n=1 Tax=Fuchsiella alkaliacetigena TaxID=957042 RepID=UPI00200A1946|nr:replicative helicase loader/inhibitor [Fuchsiella alkaliacetigena]MCK8824710.1 replicative helicase loader/inhibitor [Fuchsiella alkaliacetigena]
MTRQEVIKILSFISNAYAGKFEFPKGTEEASETLIQSWLEFLEDYEHQAAKVALKKYIVENPKWPPAVGELVQEINKIHLPEEDNLLPAEAWSQLVKAIRHYGYYREQEALESMSPLVAKTVEYMGWRELCYETNTGVLRGQFLKMYKQLQQRQQKENMLPSSLKKEIKELKGDHQKRDVLKLIDDVSDSA